jgi:general secretion pathway protein D
MRRLKPAAILLLVMVTILPAIAGKPKAKTLYEQGQDAEARQNYEQAYELYKKAYDQKPKDLRYRSSFERMRFKAAAVIVHQGILLRDDGKLEEALAKFQRAAQIDPSLFSAQQEIKNTLHMIEEKKNPQPQTAGPPSSLERKLKDATGPVELAPIASVPLTIHETEDSKVVYETIGKIAGINVLFDPDYTSRRIKVELNGVTLQEALEITALESKTFWRPVTSNTIFIATDNPAKRKELEQSVLKTFYLSNVSQPTELQDVVNAIRAVLDVQRVQQLLSQNAIVVRGTPDQISLAEKLVDDLDKARPEVLVDIAVLQISKDRSRTLGFSPPSSATVTLQSNINTSTTTTSTTGTTTPSSSSTGLELNTLGNLNATDFQVSIGSANLSAVMSDSDTKMLQNPQVRALDNQKATLKIGERVPVATGSFQPGIGGVGINPLVNTQFQYLDVGVNIDVTPHVHSDRDITLKITMEISSVVGQSSIGGISQPIIGQKKVEHEIRLRDGEPSLIGGIMDDSQTRSLAGIPGLAQIPIIKWLFGQETKDHEEDETVFAITPHVVRAVSVSEFNQRPIEIGTANAIQLHYANHPAAATQQAPQAGMPTAPTPVTPSPAPTPSAAIAPTPAAMVTPGPANFLFDPGQITTTKGGTFTVNLMISGAKDVYSVPVQLNYDDKLLDLVNISNGGFLSQDGQAVALVHRQDDKGLQITATRPPGAGGVSGQGSVVTLTFQAKASGQTPITITRGGARDPGLQAINVNGAQASVTVQ